MQKIKVAVIQFEPELFNKKRNIQILLAMAEDAARNGAKLIVMPELATTGCFFNDREEIRPYVEAIPGKTVEVFSRLSKKYNCYLTCGIPERDPDTDIFYNSAFLVGPGGQLVGRYRKTHLFFSDIRWAAAGSGIKAATSSYNSGHNEKRSYSIKENNTTNQTARAGAVNQVGRVGQGNEATSCAVPVFETDIGRISLLICMDSMYFETFRLAALGGADIICLLTNWVGDKDADVQLARSVWRTRALENAVYLLVADRWGWEGGYGFTGHSMIIDPRGKILWEKKKGNYIGYAEIDLNSVQKTRKKRHDYSENIITKRKPCRYHNLILKTYLWYPGFTFKELPAGKKTLVGIAQFSSLNKSFPGHFLLD